MTTARQIHLAERGRLLDEANVIWHLRDEEINQGLCAHSMGYALVEELAAAAEIIEARASDLYRLAYGFDWTEALADMEDYAEYGQFTQDLRHGG